MNTMTFFIDIDQTISTGFVGASVQESLAYYQARGILIPPEASRYIDIFQVPEVVRIHEVFPGAQEGIRHLLPLGNVIYATARQARVEEITREWLREQDFPAPERVLFCQGVAEKLVALAEHPGSLVLVDDRWHQLLNILETYGKRRALRDLVERLTLVAFGADQTDLPGSAVVPIMPLPDWFGVTDVIHQLTGASEPSLKNRRIL